MKTTFKTLAIATIIMATSCATTVIFPVSTVVPAAVISAQKSTDKQNNFTLKLIIKNLASIDRLDPPGTNYSVWIVTNDYGVKNIGQLNVKNAQTTSFTAETPYGFYEVFITVENHGDLLYPAGKEITRTKI